MQTFILGAALLLAPVGPLFAQVFDQQSTRQKLLVEQIAVLKLYRLSAQQGYKTLTQGWAQVGGRAAQEYALHIQYFAALAAVNPQLLAYVQNHSIVNTQSGH
jgi:hypothetical protein